jgi:hypothetical protein
LILLLLLLQLLLLLSLQLFMLLEFLFRQSEDALLFLLLLPVSLLQLSFLALFFILLSLLFRALGCFFLCNLCLQGLAQSYLLFGGSQARRGDGRLRSEGA